MSRFNTLCRQYKETRGNFNQVVGGYLRWLQMTLLNQTEHTDDLYKKLQFFSKYQYRLISGKTRSGGGYLQSAGQKLAYAQLNLVSGSRDNLSSKELSIYDIYNVSSRLFSLYQEYFEYVERTALSIWRSYHSWHAKQQSLKYLRMEMSKSETMTSCLKKFQKKCCHGGRVEFTHDNIKQAKELFSELCSLLTAHVSGVDIDPGVKSQLIQVFSSLAGQRMSSPNHVSQVADKAFLKADSNSKPNQWAACFDFAAKDCTRKSDNTPGIPGMQKAVRGAKRLKLGALI